MISYKDPVFDPSTYTTFGTFYLITQGKEMDGWETRRMRIVGHDFCIIKLGLAGTICGFEIDTAFFTGNHVPFVSIQGAYLEHDVEFKRKSKMGTCASSMEISEVESLTSSWKMILPITKLEPGYPETRFNRFTCGSKQIVTHLKVNLLPDGGIARYFIIILRRDYEFLEGYKRIGQQ